MRPKLAHGSSVHYLQQLEAVQSFGIIVTVSPVTFAKIIAQQERPLIITALGGFFRHYHRYLTSYKGLAFFTKSSVPLELPDMSEIVYARKIRIPFESFKMPQ
jgi:hypothetical protein